MRDTQNAIRTESDSRWALVVARDVEADGIFYYSVKTTGVYCRPSCAARLARPEHVQFHKTCQEAEEAGFRPCKRCKPNQPSLLEQHSMQVAKACQLIADSEKPLSLEELATQVGMSRYHFHRVFKAITGLTPKSYTAMNRAQRVRNKLNRNGTVTEAIYDAGYSSSGRFYETSDQVLGMTPSNFRAGGAHTEIHFAIGECFLGFILVARSDRGVCAILLGDDPDALTRDLQNSFPQANLVGTDGEFEQVVSKVIGFIEAATVGLDLPLDIQGTAFQQRVWQALRDIPVGMTTSYADIAHRIGSPKSVRAVALACGANTLAVAIPCHRVVRNDGALSGYRWGIERKRVLLEREVNQARAVTVAPAVRSIEERVKALNFEHIFYDLDTQGYAILECLLSPDECRALAELYHQDGMFRSRVVMGQHGFGRGEYKYFLYPLPDLITELRTTLYTSLAPIANRWNEAMGIDVRYPERHVDFIIRCHEDGQVKPTPLLLRYGADDYNCLHQDLYGKHVFPIQVAILLSEPATDFTGGEFVLTEQRPRMQSRPMVVPLRQGDAVAFAVHHRPVQGTRGVYRVNLRHGVSRIRSGLRYTVGIIFHDAQ